MEQGLYWKSHYLDECIAPTFPGELLVIDIVVPSKKDSGRTGMQLYKILYWGFLIVSSKV